MLAAVRETLGADGQPARRRQRRLGRGDRARAPARLRALPARGLRAALRGRRLRGPGLADRALAGARDRRRVAGLARGRASAWSSSRACHVFNVRISKCGGLLGAGPHPRSRARGGHRHDARRARGRDRDPRRRRPPASPRARPGCASPRAPTASSCCEADVSDAMDLGPGGIGRGDSRATASASTSISSASRRTSVVLEAHGVTPGDGPRSEEPRLNRVTPFLMFDDQLEEPSSSSRPRSPTPRS